MTMSRSSRKKTSEPIVIDEAEGLVFRTEQELYAHFEKEIQVLEREFYSLRDKQDINEFKFDKYDGQLELLLDDPDEVWEDSDTLTGQRMFIYIRAFEKNIFHVAACYLIAW